MRITLRIRLVGEEVHSDDRVAAAVRAGLAGLNDRSGTVVGEPGIVGKQALSSGNRAVRSTRFAVKLGGGRERRLIGRILKLSVHRGYPGIVERDSAHGDQANEGKRDGWRDRAITIS